MILGVGMDLCDVQRVARQLRQHDPGFLRQLFTPGEIADGAQCREPARHYAACFAAKEAVFKSLAIVATAPRWREMEIRPVSPGAACVILHGRTREAAARLGVRRVLASVAHTRQVALASVILES